MNATGLAAVLMAAAAIVTAVGGVFFNQRGRRDTRQQQQAANAMQDTALNMQAIEKRAEMAEAGEREQRSLRREAETELQETRLRHRHEEAAQRTRCLEHASELTDALLTLRATVASEIAKAAADAATRLPDHPHDPEEI